MPTPTPARIQQQMYTRERRGVFRSTEGYDTIALSTGLDSQLVKKQLHPYCVYDAPAELAGRGEKDASAYPETVHAVRLDNGDLLLGRSVYVPADFTGLRSTFFTHNYIIPAGRLEQESADVPSWLNADFQSSYAIDQGSELPELDELPMRAPALDEPAREALRRMGLDEKRYKQLLFAVMTAVGGKKKVYLALDVPIGELPLRARQLLQLLYTSLPPAFRRQLGFITYAKDPQSRKSVHLIFVEKGSLRPGDRTLEREFVFDLPSDRVVNVNYEGDGQAFLDLAWANLEQPERAAQFAEFAERMLADMGAEHHTSMADYHHLALLYRVGEGDRAAYEAERLTVLRSALSYLKPDGALPRKPQLLQLMGARFQDENAALQAGRLPEPAVVQVFADFYGAGGTAIESQLVRYFMMAIQAAVREQRGEEAAAYYRALESQPRLSEAFFRKVLADERLTAQLFEPYLARKLKDASQLRDVLQVTLQWLTRNVELLSSAAFSALVRMRLAEMLAKDRQPLTAAAKAYEALDKFAGEAQAALPQVEKAELSELTQQLEMTVYRTMLTELSWESLTREQLGQAEFLKDGERLALWNERLGDGRQQSAAAVLQALHRWFVRPKPDNRVFDGLDPAEIDRAQQLGRRWLAVSIEPSQFARITIAFCNSSDVTAIDYPGLIEFLRQHAKSPETIYQFFQWSEEHPAFMRPRGFVPAYTTAVLAYFRTHDRDAFKSRAHRRTYYDGAGPAMKAVYGQVRGEHASPLGKLLRGRRGKLFLSSLVTIGAVLLVLSFVLQDKGDGETPVPGTPGAGGTTGESPTQGESDPVTTIWPDTLVYAVQPGADEPSANTELELLFRVPAACAELESEDLGSFVLETPDGKEHGFRDMSFKADCGGDEAPDGSGMEGGNTSGAGTGKDNTDSGAGKGTNSSSGAGTGGAGGSDAGNGGSSGGVNDRTSGSGTRDNSASGSSTRNGSNSGSGTATPPGDSTDRAASDDRSASDDAATSGSAGTRDGDTSDTGTDKSGANGGGVSGGTGTQDTDGSVPEADMTLEEIYPARIVISLGERLELPEGTILRFDTRSYELSAAPEQEETPPVETETP